MGISSYHSNGQRPLGPDSTVPKEECERIIQTLLQKVSYKYPKLEHRSDLKPKLENNLRALGLGDDLIQRHNGAAISTTLPITVLTGDLAAEIRGPLHRYAGQLVKGEQHEHVLLIAMTRWLAQHAREFGVFGGNMLIKSTVDCISAKHMRLVRIVD
ncbi:uncharacterized protein ASPGLDRAFT_56060 [Aspergillus glaucus CBS 516.65]|uniref:Uncharacterized protein n=1 Tax=Aspergillus glaucus CBS 516.65 TaxID=1160497 RepID=A0A1L9VRE1_ASPGL|nr:hypothetical protein ASPGLDRAFT_56060 [Aspergillus glaucus CBS 516.65]OJJ86454.1 hypothetical protein ASPGLDRAFT_56060 [Aspergillus glaucus CBS 516.65]